MAAECAAYEEKRVKNKSTYWMVFELIWRDYYRCYCAKHGRAVFKEGGPVDSHQSWRNDPQLLRRWKEGTLGVPLIDANMRELAATGFMSNRGRQNVASCVDTYVPGPPYCTYGLRAPASCVLYGT